jgi:hypothetical protein
MLDSPRGRFAACRRGLGGTVPGYNDTVGSGTQGCPGHGAKVLWVQDLIQYQYQGRVVVFARGGHDVFQRAKRERRYFRRSALVTLVPGQPVQDIIRNPLDIYVNPCGKKLDLLPANGLSGLIKKDLPNLPTLGAQRFNNRVISV